MFATLALVIGALVVITMRDAGDFSNLLFVAMHIGPEQAAPAEHLQLTVTAEHVVLVVFKQIAPVVVLVVPAVDIVAGPAVMQHMAEQQTHRYNVRAAAPLLPAEGRANHIVPVRITKIACADVLQA